MKACCQKHSDSAFCPVCGANLSDNPYIGRTEASLRYELDEVNHNIQWAQDKIASCEAEVRKARLAAEPHFACASQIRYAIEYARAQGIEE